MACLPDNWIYIQEPDVKIGRLQVFNNWSPAMVADPSTIWLGLEYFCGEGDDLWSMHDSRFIDFAASELEKIGLISRRDVLDGTLVRVPKAYPAYFGAYGEFGKVREYLNRFSNLYPVGRNGMHRYNNQDHSMLAANRAVDSIINHGQEKRKRRLGTLIRKTSITRLLANTVKPPPAASNGRENDDHHPPAGSLVNVSRAPNFRESASTTPASSAPPARFPGSCPRIPPPRSSRDPSSRARCRPGP